MPSRISRTKNSAIASGLRYPKKFGSSRNAYTPVATTMLMSTSALMRWMRGTKYDVRDSWRVLATLANALGFKWKYAATQDVFAEMAAKIPELKGLTYHRLDRMGAPLQEARKTAVAAGA